MTINNPCLVTIKFLAVGGAPNVKDVTAALAEFGSVMQYEAANLVFDGNALVPAPAPDVGLPAANSPAPTAPKAKKGGIKPEKQKEVVRRVQAEQAMKRAKEKQQSGDAKPINLAEGSNPARIFEFIRSGAAVTSTQIREKLGLDSNVVNTTVYRLKGAGMIRPMSHNAPNGDTLYTSTEWDPKPQAVVPVQEVTDGEE